MTQAAVGTLLHHPRLASHKGLTRFSTRPVAISLVSSCLSQLALSLIAQLHAGQQEQA